MDHELSMLPKKRVIAISWITTRGRGGVIPQFVVAVNSGDRPTRGTGQLGGQANSGDSIPISLEPFRIAFGKEAKEMNNGQDGACSGTWISASCHSTW